MFRDGGEDFYSVEGDLNSGPIVCSGRFLGVLTATDDNFDLNCGVVGTDGLSDASSDAVCES